MTALINELAAQPGADEMLLVLDDYHLIDSQPVHASLTFLLEHLPPGLHPVLASRADPPLPLTWLRARGRLAELRAAELRFTAGEAGRRPCMAVLGTLRISGSEPAGYDGLIVELDGVVSRGDDRSRVLPRRSPPCAPTSPGCSSGPASRGELAKVPWQP